MDEEERRALLRSQTDEEYTDIMNVCATLPNVEMVIRSEGKHFALCFNGTF